MPRTPPATATMTLSVSSWRDPMLPGANADRMAISRDRAVARASIRLATFAQAMRSTNVTAPIIVSVISLMSDGMNVSRNGVTFALQSAFSR